MENVTYMYMYMYHDSTMKTTKFTGVQVHLCMYTCNNTSECKRSCEYFKWSCERLTSTDEESVWHEGLEEVDVLCSLLSIKLTKLKVYCLSRREIHVQSLTEVINRSIDT